MRAPRRNRSLAVYGESASFLPSSVAVAASFTAARIAVLSAVGENVKIEVEAELVAQDASPVAGAAGWA